MKTKIILTALTLILSLSLKAESVVCETPAGGKIVKILNESVKFYADYSSIDQNREIASADAVRDMSRGKSIEKVLLHNGNRYTIHIEERHNFSNVNDYMTIRSNKGHEVIYPLDCKLF